MASKIKLQDAADEYISHCSLDLEASTVRAYRSALDALVDGAGNIEVARLTTKHISQTFAKRHWSPSTRNGRLAQFKGFFSWCRAVGYMHRDSDPTFGIRNVKVPEVERLRIPVAEWPRLFDACRHPQETIVLATGLFLFLRASEQKRIQLKHVSLMTDEITIHRIKNKHMDVMPVTSELGVYLRRHLTFLAEQGFTHPDNYLISARVQMERDAKKQFIGGTGVFDATKPLYAPHTVVQRVMKRAGYPVLKEGEHTLRRSGARAYFDALVEDGYDGALRRVQSMLGHKDTKTTEHYLGLDPERLKRNQDLRGKPMFPAVRNANVVPIREVM